jgi:glycosyltransferase involved in cell wall biosynthesis
VDDGSSDPTLEVAKQYEVHGVMVVSQRNAGASAARNHALRIATGEYIQFLDADDQISPNKIALQLNRLLSSTSGYIASGEWARFHIDPSEAKFSSEPNWQDMSALEFQLLQNEGGWMMQPAAWLCPREIIDSAGPWDETLTTNDDGEYFCRVMFSSKGILFCNGARTYYRSGILGSLSQQSSPKDLHAIWKTTEYNCRRILEAAHNSPRAKNAVANAWQRLSYELYPTLPRLADKAEANMRAHGGTSIPLPVTPTFQRIAKIFGWRITKRLLGYYNCIR